VDLVGRGDRPVRAGAPEDQVHEAPGFGVGDPALAVTGFHVRVRFEDDAGVRLARADGAQEVEVAPDRATAAPDRSVVLDLTRHQDLAPRIGLEAERRLAAEIVLRDSGLEQALAQRRCPGQGVEVEVLELEDLLEFAEPARVVVDAAPVEDERRAGEEVGAEADRAQEAVLDPDHRHRNPARRGAQLLGLL
jgi:electron transfer flavoprotein alpha subunit